MGWDPMSQGLPSLLDGRTSDEPRAVVPHDQASVPQDQPASPQMGSPGWSEALTKAFADATRAAINQAFAAGLAVPGYRDGQAVETRPDGSVVPIDDSKTWSPTAWADRDERWSTWMEATQKGDHQAYRQLLHAILPYVRRITARSFRGSADAEDAAQDVLIALHEARASYDPARPFGPWLAAIARYRIIDRLRRKEQRAARETPLEPMHETLEDVPTSDDRMIIATRSLHAMIDRLLDDQRLALPELKLRERTLHEDHRHG